MVYFKQTVHGRTVFKAYPNAPLLPTILSCIPSRLPIKPGHFGITRITVRVLRCITTVASNGYTYTQLPNIVMDFVARLSSMTRVIRISHCEY